MQPQSRIHKRLSNDVRDMIKDFAPGHEQQQFKKHIMEHIESILRNDFGPTYSIIDIGISALGTDVSAVPIELAIVDEERPYRSIPAEVEKELPPVYDTETILRHFTERGFKISVEEGNGQAASLRNEVPLVPPPDYTLPPRLVCSEPAPGFFLSLPSPLHQPTLEIIQAYSKLLPAWRDALTATMLWLHSWDFKDVDAITLAFIMISFLQGGDSGVRFPNLQDPGLLPLDSRDEVWLNPHGPNGQVKLELVDLTFFREYKGTVTNETVANILDGFFNWIARVGKQHFLSPRYGGKAFRYSGTMSESNLKGKDALSGRSTSKARQELVQSYAKTVDWQTAAMIVQNPFYPKHNHTSHILPQSFQALKRNALFASSFLRNQCLLQEIFGPSLLRNNVSYVASYREMTTFHPDLREHLVQLYKSNEPTSDIMIRRSTLIARIQRIVQKRYGKEYRVESFGSTRYGVDSKTSDLDLIIIDPQRPDGFPPNVDLDALPRVYDVIQLSNLFRKSDFRQVNAIPGASVPIVKFSDPDSSLQVDININDQLGLHNTNLLSFYCSLWPPLRILAFILKRWAKSHGLNDPSGSRGAATFSSYSLTLMAVAYLQMKGLLPNLQGITLDGEPSTQDVFWIKLANGARERCDIRFSNGQGWVAPAKLELEEALYGWFRYYGHIHLYTQTAINIREGGLVHRKLRPKPKKSDKNGKTKKADNNAPQETPIVTPERNETPLEDNDAASESEVDEDEVILVPRGLPLTALPGSGQEGEAQLKAVQDKELAEDLAKLEFTDDEWNEPKSWMQHAMIVADPFITAKNCCSAISKKSITKFKSECQKASDVLKKGKPLADIYGAGQSFGPPRRGRFRGRGGGDRGARGGQSTGRGRGRGE